MWSVWIGATDSKDEGNWYWIEGSLVDRLGVVTFWGPKQPNGIYSQNCLAYYYFYDGGYSWDDDSCGREHTFICEIFIQ